MKKANQDELIAAVKENLLRPRGERMTCKQLGELFNVSGPRISQIASRLRQKEENVSTAQPEATEAQEAV